MKRSVMPKTNKTAKQPSVTRQLAQEIAIIDLGKKPRAVFPESNNPFFPNDAGPFSESEDSVLFLTLAVTNAITSLGDQRPATGLVHCRISIDSGKKRRFFISRKDAKQLDDELDEIECIFASATANGLAFTLSDSGICIGITYEATGPVPAHEPSQKLDRKPILRHYCSDGSRQGGSQVVRPDVPALPQPEPPDMQHQYVTRDEVSRAVLKNPSKVLKTLATIKRKLDDVQKPIVTEIQQLLLSVEGLDLGSFEANKEFATAVQELLDRLNVRAQCPHDDCHEMARFECTQAGRTRHGSFRMVHRIGERHQAHQSCTVIPRLSLHSLNRCE